MRSKSPTLTPPEVTMASQVVAASAMVEVMRASSSATVPRLTASNPLAATSASSIGRLESRI